MKVGILEGDISLGTILLRGGGSRWSDFSSTSSSASLESGLFKRFNGKRAAIALCSCVAEF